jgi:hypothetical protein
MITTLTIINQGIIIYAGYTVNRNQHIPAASLVKGKKGITATP